GRRDPTEAAEQILLAAEHGVGRAFGDGAREGIAHVVSRPDAAVGAGRCELPIERALADRDARAPRHAAEDEGRPHGSISSAAPTIESWTSVPSQRSGGSPALARCASGLSGSLSRASARRRRASRARATRRATTSN